jgi:hypothetical protein
VQLTKVVLSPKAKTPTDDRGSNPYRAVTARERSLSSECVSLHERLGYPEIRGRALGAQCARARQKVNRATNWPCRGRLAPEASAVLIHPKPEAIVSPAVQAPTRPLAL